eukprot:COSAG02_NODE_667_length_18713_cov_17.795262_12_plen_31_part_00
MYRGIKSEGAPKGAGTLMVMVMVMATVKLV